MDSGTKSTGETGIRNDLLKAVAVERARKRAADRAATEALQEQAAANRSLGDAWEALQAHVDKMVDDYGIDAFDTTAFEAPATEAP